MNKRDDFELGIALDADEFDELESFELDEALRTETFSQIRNQDFEPIGFDWG